MHASITTIDTGGPEGLPLYVARGHDQHLRSILRGRVERGESGLVMLVGDSCTGKTRALYEAVIDPTVGVITLPVYKPDTQTTLTNQLRAGLVGPVIVWLDELQRYVDHHDGATIAGALHNLLTTPPERVGGPILVVATLWTTTRDALTAEPRSDPSGTAASAHQVRELLSSAQQVAVAPDFTSADPVELRRAGAADPRVRAALQVAGDPARITQVLAGGTNLLARLYPNDPDLQRAADQAGPIFHPPARAVIYVAGELRRVGWGEDPIPEPVLRGVAAGYLDGPHHLGWFERGLAEATHDADADHDQLLNIHTHGIPALSALENPDGQPVYQLHDYLAQDHQHRHRYTPTRQSLWDALTDQLDTLDIPVEVAQAAADRGLFSPAIKLLRAHADRGTVVLAEDLLAELLADRATQGDANAFSELRLHGGANRFAADRLVALLADRAARGDADALLELKHRAGSGESRAADQLVGLLADRAAGGDADAFAELRRAGTRNRFTRAYLARVLADRATRGDHDALAELRTRVDSGGIDFELTLAAVLASRADDGDTDTLTELRVRAHRGRWVFRLKLADLLAGRATKGDQDALAELRTFSGDGFLPAEAQAAHVVLTPAAQGDEGDLAELRSRANSGQRFHSARFGVVLAWRAAQGDQAALYELRTRAATGDWTSQLPLGELLANRAEEGDENALNELLELLSSINDRWPLHHRLFALLADKATHGNADATVQLRRFVHAGAGAQELLRSYRRRWVTPTVRELDVDAEPLFEDGQRL